MGSGAITTYRPGPLKPFRDAPAIKVEVSFASNYNAAAPTYVDLTGRIRFTSGTGITFNRGRNDEWGEIAPGQCTITFNNFDRFLDPSFGGSPYWPNVDWGRPMKITAYYLGVTYVLFTGLVQNWECSWTAGGDAICTATCVEQLGMLALSRIAAATILSTTVQGRLTDLCTSAGVPAAFQDFQTGSYQLKAQSYVSQDALSACQQVAAGQNQIFFTSRDGFFRNRAAYTQFDTSLGTFGENAGEIHCARMLAPSIGDPYTYTIVKIHASDAADGSLGAVVTANVPTNLGHPGGGGPTRLGSNMLERTIAATPSATLVAGAIATAIATKQGPRIKQATLFPMRDPTNAWPPVLDADIGNGATFKYSAPGGGPRFSQPSIVMSVAHTITGENWVANWNLSP
ncbi:MAG TPA: hypothetical protein VNN79_18920 [Actinomycetota bacterium]|nr:hypothetical protein [Actinomycetota bacterium]